VRVRELLAKGADPNRRPTGRPTPLIAAASAGHLEVVKKLVEAGANPSFAHGGKRGTTALLEAIRHHRFDVAHTLVVAGADIHHDWSGEGQTITYSAVDLCNKLYRSAKGAERKKVSECLKIARELLGKGGKAPSRLLCSAAAVGNWKLIELLLEFGADINTKDGKGIAFDSTAFSCAVSNHHEEVAVELLRRGADPWADRPILSPALHTAVTEGFTKVVRAFIEMKADLNRRGDTAIGERPEDTLNEEKDARGNIVGRSWTVHERPTARDTTALIATVRTNKKDMVKLLVEGGADLEETDGDGFTALSWALKLGRIDLCKILRHAGAKEPQHLEGSPQFALITAAATGDIERLRAALARGADANALYDHGRERFTALMKAAEAGHVAIIDELVNAGADPNKAGMSRTFDLNVTPLIVAASSGHAGVVKRLLEAGAKPETQQVNLFYLRNMRQHQGDAAIHEAAKAGHGDVVKLLLEAGARPQNLSSDSGTVLDAAASSGKRDVVKTVLSAKARLGTKATVAVSALINAVGSGNQQTVRELLGAGADVNARTRRGDSALAEAVAKEDTAMVQLLLEWGAKPAVGQRKSTITVLMMAADGGHTDLIKLLLNAGADINEQSIYGTTALYCAASSGHPEAVEALLCAGASAQLCDDEGKTPLQAARQIISAWTGKNRHPIIGELPNLAGYRRCVKILEETD
jgi:ankyrin repeat protein